MESNQQHIHSFEHTVVPSTCTQRGYTLHRCACGYEHKDQFTPQSQHTFALVEEIEPGCTVEGACKTRCTQCGQERVTPIPAIGHKWGEWTIQKYATCTESGLQIRPCTRCDVTEERAIPATGHKVVSEKRNGVEEYYCANCGMPMEKPVAAPVPEVPVQPQAAPVPPVAAPVQPQQKAPAQPRQKAPAKAKKNGWKKWLIAIVAVILLLAAAVSAIYIIKPDFYYDFIDEHPFFDILGDNEYDDEDEEEDDEDDNKKGKDKETTPSTGSTEGTKGTENTAANENTNPTGNEGGNAAFGVPVGTELTEPEVVFDLDLYNQLQFSATIQNGTQQMVMEIALIQNADGTGVYYMAQGNNAAVVERTSTGLLGYLKNGNASFAQDTTVSQDELQGTLTSIEKIVSIFADYMTNFNGAIYRKINPSVNCPTGPVFAYEVLQNGQVKGEICIDQATGLMVYIKNLENGAVMDVQSYTVNGVQLPAYK